MYELYEWSRGGQFGWETSRTITSGMRRCMRVLHRAFHDDECFYGRRQGRRHVTVQFGDASGKYCGGATRSPSGAVEAWNAKWPERVRHAFGSNYKELRRVLVQMQRHLAAHESGAARSVAGHSILDFTDNTYTASVLARGRADTVEGTALVRAISRIADKLDVDLHVFHVAGERLVANGVDGLSRPDGKMGESVATADWPRALAPARPSQGLVSLISDVFGARGLVTSPLRPGQMAGRRELIMPSPWVAAEVAEASKLAATMDPATDIVLVLPDRARVRWRRACRVFSEVACIRAGEHPCWPKSEHESLYILWLPPHHIPPPHRDKYFHKHGSPTQRLALQELRRRDPEPRLRAAMLELRSRLRKA